MSGATLLRGRLAGALRVPGSKSVTNRALLAAACADGESTLLNPLDSSDTRALAAALRLLGAEISFEGVSWRVIGPMRPQRSTRRRSWSSTSEMQGRRRVSWPLSSPRCRAASFSTAASRMRERPMSPLFEAIRALGGQIRCIGREGHLPPRIRGGTLRGGRVAIRGDVSSQFLSALQLVSPLVPGGVALDVTGPVASAAYLSLTRRVLEGFGAAPGGGYRPARFRVPGDDSAACFPLAGALVSGGRVTLSGLARDSGAARRRIPRLGRRPRRDARVGDGNGRRGGAHRDRARGRRALAPADGRRRGRGPRRGAAARGGARVRGRLRRGSAASPGCARRNPTASRRPSTS